MQYTINTGGLIDGPHNFPNHQNSIILGTMLPLPPSSYETEMEKITRLTKGEEYIKHKIVFGNGIPSTINSAFKDYK